jgi:hypothetical protein
LGLLRRTRMLGLQQFYSEMETTQLQTSNINLKRESNLTEPESDTDAVTDMAIGSRLKTKRALQSLAAIPSAHPGT